MSSYNPVQQWQSTDDELSMPIVPATPTLVIGDLNRWAKQGRPTPSLDGLHFTDIDAVNTNLLEQLKPAMVLSPLLGDQFDAIDVAKSLVSIGYTGRYCAVTEQLPDSRLVLQEIRSAAPGLDVVLFILPPKAANN